MERERITISIKKSLLLEIDKTIDGVNIRNRSHAIETLSNKALCNRNIEKAIILLGGKNAIDRIPAAKKYLAFLQSIGFTEVFIAVGFLADKIKEKIGFGEEYNLKISYLEKGEGSAGALLPLKKIMNAPFVVVNVSEYHELNYEKLLNYHNKFNLIATLAVNEIDDFAGLYIFDPKVFTFIPKGFSMLEKDIFPKLMEKNQLIVFPISN